MAESTTPNAPNRKAADLEEKTKHIEPRSVDASGDTQQTTIVPGDTILNTYRIESVLASGGMGRVFLARHIHLSTYHAIKVIKPELFSNQQVLDLFRREAAVLRDIRNDAIVSYDGFVVDERGRDYLVMEFVEGPSLASVLEKGPLSLEQIYVLRDRLVIGLGAAHAKGVVHRDISPDNIIFPENRIERAKLIDFGTCKLTAASAETIVGDGFVGKFRFVSPEQAGATVSTKVDARSDIYSLGLVLAAAALGAPLNMGDSIDKVILARRQIPDLSQLPEELQPQLRAMLQPDPADRPQSVGDLIRNWPTPGTAQQRSSPSIPDAPRQVRPIPAAGTTTPGQPAARRISVMLLVGMLVILGIGSGLYFSFWNAPPSARQASPFKAESTGTLGTGQLAEKPWREISPHLEELIVKGHHNKAFELLSEAEKYGHEPPPHQTYEIARTFLSYGLAEHSLLLFKASARRNHGPSAVAIAEMYDPVLWSSVSSPLSRPEWSEADKWYRRALALGVEDARERIRQLELWKSAQNPGDDE